jgi:hypothetical protein
MIEADWRYQAVAEWNIERSKNCCAVTGRPFVAGDRLWSGLFEVEGNLCRADFSEEGWQARQQALEAGETLPEARVVLPPTEEGGEPRAVALEGPALAVWQHVKTAGDERPKRRYVDDEVLLDFFRRREDTTNERQRAFRFVLALHLIRRKRLKLMSMERDDEGGWLICQEPKVDDVRYRVFDPQLNEEEVLELREQMSSVLDMDEEDDEAAAEEGSEPNAAPAEVPANSDGEGTSEAD